MIQSFLANWFTIGVVLMILEMVIPGIFLMWFGISALIVGTIALLLPIDMNTQLVIFAVVSVVSVIAVLIFMRKRIPESKSTVTSNLNQARGAELIGQTYTLTSDVVNGEGKLSIGDTVWLIRGANAVTGSTIKIEKIENNALIFSIVE